jgi:hypothetical protein
MTRTIPFQSHTASSVVTTPTIYRAIADELILLISNFAISYICLLLLFILTSRRNFTLDLFLDYAT